MVRQSDRILLVDDELSSLEVLSEVLTRARYEVASADCGYNALKIAQECSIDLAILDFNLPDTTGIELLQQIKRLQPDTPVILMSANTSQGLQLDAFEAGAYTFMSKPINLQQLLRFVARALDLKKRWSAEHQAGEQNGRPVARTQTVQVKRSVIFRWIRIIRQK
jgi:DNA-binding NtrC family response regulator